MRLLKVHSIFRGGLWDAVTLLNCRIKPFVPEFLVVVFFLYLNIFKLKLLFFFSLTSALSTFLYVSRSFVVLSTLVEKTSYAIPPFAKSQTMAQAVKMAALFFFFSLTEAKVITQRGTHHAWMHCSGFRIPKNQYDFFFFSPRAPLLGRISFWRHHTSLT